MTLANRILGFVNAPALMQRVIGTLQGQSVDVALYAGKRDLCAGGWPIAGMNFQNRPARFIFFRKRPFPMTSNLFRRCRKNAFWLFREAVSADPATFESPSAWKMP